MFSLAKASAAVLALASFAQATISIAPPDLKGNATNTITWTSSDINSDPETFSIELINKLFNSQFALGNNIATTSGSFTFEMPVVAPGSGYSIQFVNPGNINDIIASSAPFAVQENDITSTTAATSGASSASSVVASRTSALSSVSSSVGTLTHSGTLTQTGSAATGTAPSTVAGVSSAASGTASAPASSTSTKSNAALGLVPSGSFAALVAGVLALLV